MMKKVKEGVLILICAVAVLAMITTQIYLLEYAAAQPRTKIVSDHWTTPGNM